MLGAVSAEGYLMGQVRQAELKEKLKKYTPMGCHVNVNFNLFGKSSKILDFKKLQELSNVCETV